MAPTNLSRIDFDFRMINPPVKFPNRFYKENRLTYDRRGFCTVQFVSSIIIMPLYRNLSISY
jgi:hypothetical protein